MRKYTYIFPVIFIILIACTPSKQFLIKKNSYDNLNKDYIRVLIGKFDNDVKISSKSRLKITEKTTRKIIYDSTNSSVTIPVNKITNPIVIESWNSPIFINNTPYRGTVEIHNVIGKLFAINVILINEYLFSVVPGEIPASWNIQALKAQAVAARTYTYYHLINNNNVLYDLDSTTKFQVYKGVSVENPSTSEAVLQTTGEILSSNNQTILSIFHSTCGGKTISDRLIWGGKGHEYLDGVRCSFCKDSPEYSWETNLSLYEIKNILNSKHKGVGEIQNITFIKKNDRVIQVIVIHKFGKIEMSGNDFRLLFPAKKLRSMFFTSKKTRDGLILLGKGWGHGVGLCQWGAKGMSDKGANYKSILKFYYNNRIKIVKIDNNPNKKLATMNNGHKFHELPD